MSDRHQPKNFLEAAKDSCPYCHHTPAIWQHIGDEKVCIHCGTRHSTSNPFVTPQMKVTKQPAR
jgi:hypothetical protein